MKLADNVKLERVEDVISPYIAHVQSTYTASFPEVERRDFSLFCELIEKNPDFALFIILRDDRYVGFITCWDFREFAYVEHFAIDEASRGGGIGSIAMKEILKRMRRKVVLEVEEVVDELTQRRVAFYEALGFKRHEHAYKQPPYRKGDPWNAMNLMTFGEFDMDKQFDSVKEILYKNVYNTQKAG